MSLNDQLHCTVLGFDSCKLQLVLPAVVINLIVIITFRLFYNASSNSGVPNETSFLLNRANVPNTNRYLPNTKQIYITGSLILLLTLDLVVILYSSLVNLTWSSTGYSWFVFLQLLAWSSLSFHLILTVPLTSKYFHLLGCMLSGIELINSTRWLVYLVSNGFVTDYTLFLITAFLRMGLSGLFLNEGLASYFKKDRNLSLNDIESNLETTPTTSNVTSSSDTKLTLTQQFKILLPYLWPKPFHLKVYIVLAFVFLGLGLVVNPLVPLQYKYIVDLLTDPDDSKGQVFNALLVYFVLNFLRGGNGLIKGLQAWTLIPINQFVNRTVSVDTFSHLHHLSMQFHVKRKTGEVLRTMDRGTSSIVNLMNYLVFNIAPTLLDILIAMVVLFAMFDIGYSIIIGIAMVVYIVMTVVITEWRTKFRRAMNEMDSKVRGIAVDSLLNYETVKLFTAEQFETDRYEEAIVKYLDADFKSNATLPILNLAQGTILALATLAASLRCASQIVGHEKRVGDLVLLITYLVQLSTPLNFFGTLYRMIQQNFVDMEAMVKLLITNSDIVDDPQALTLENNNLEPCSVVFDKVDFSYDPNRKVLDQLSFTIPPGTSAALVGPSGGGKSTLLKLLNRFYEVDHGSIQINGKDIRSLKQQSLRRLVGVVPQDVVLFNADIMYNIRYGNPDASDEQVYQAAQQAAIHEKIMSFPKGYETIVGERGLRLSGGEKQRVAVARTLLKDPKIVILDEATSALDSHTEAELQKAFTKAFDQRTSITIAHRLSTIVNVDQILVVVNGKVMEQGSHQELIQREDGIYKGMWDKQLHGEEEELLKGDLVKEEQGKDNV